MALEDVVDPVGATLEIVGVAIVAGGTLLSLAAMALRWLRHRTPGRPQPDAPPTAAASAPETGEIETGGAGGTETGGAAGGIHSGSGANTGNGDGGDEASGDTRSLYVEGRRSVGRSILLGIEVLVAGDIIRTVAVSPSFTSVGVLAGIVAIRTFLSFTLEVEITGQWPWQQQPRESASGEI
jgi:hypothetical protein